MTGPYQNLPSHGIAFDTWAGLINPAYDEEGYCYIPEHASVGMHAGPMFGALGVLAGIIRARDTGELDVLFDVGARHVEAVLAERRGGAAAARLREGREEGRRAEAGDQVALIHESGETAGKGPERTGGPGRERTEPYRNPRCCGG